MIKVKVNIDGLELIEGFEFLQDNHGKEIYLSEVINVRSNLQNAYLHQAFKILSNESGYTPAEEKTLFKHYIGLVKRFEKDGECYFIYGETSKLSKKEFSEMTDRLLQFAAERGIRLLSPVEFNQGLK